MQKQRKKQMQKQMVRGKIYIFTHSRREDANASPPPLLKGGKRNAF